MTTFERIVEMPRGSFWIWFVLKGPKGAVQFVMDSGWWNQSKPRGTDIGYHSPTPRYDGQTAMQQHCEHTGGICYYDGSSLRADEEWMPQFLKGGTAWLWPRLEAEYRAVFEAEPGT